jgi:hypothetical protein
MRSIHEELLANYDCTEDQPSAQQGGSAPAQQGHQNGSSRLSEDVKLSLPQLKQLHLAYLQRGQSQTAPSQSTSSQQNTAPTLIPTQRSVTHQIIKKWGPYAEVRDKFNSSRHKEQLSLHFPQKIAATDSALRELCAHWNLRRKTHSLTRNAGSPWGFSAKSSLCTTQTAGTFPSGRPSSAPLFVNVSQSLLPSPSNPTPEQHAGAISSSLSCMAITLAHVKVTQGAAKSYEWMVAQLGPLFGTTGHKFKTQGITPSSGLKLGDIEIINYLSDSASSRNLIINVSITHDRHGSSSAHPYLNGTLSHPDTPDDPLNEADKRKVNKYRRSDTGCAEGQGKANG